MPALRIRPAEATDLVALTEELGQGPFFTDRLDRQANGRGLLLTAWLTNNRPIGDVYLWLEEAEEEPIRHHLPDTPLITHLEIHPDHRRQGSGTKLVRAAEQELAELGHNLVALAVEETNKGAMRLYHRLDYQEWPHPTIECLTMADATGFRKSETCLIMVKHLP